MTKAAAKKLYEKTGKFLKIAVIMPIDDAFLIWQLLFIHSFIHSFLLSFILSFSQSVSQSVSHSFFGSHGRLFFLWKPLISIGNHTVSSSIWN